MKETKTVKASSWLGGKQRKQGVSGGAAVRDLSHLWKLFPFSFLSGYGVIACLPVLFQDCLLTHTFVKGPVQMEYENKLHLLDTSVTSLPQAAEGRSWVKRKARRMWHRTEVPCLSFCCSIYARINRKGWESMSAHKKLVRSNLYQFTGIFTICPMQSPSISSVFP